MEWLITVVVAYLLGALPTAYVLGRYVKRVDIRGLGTQNVGALNAYRQLGRRAGVIVLAIDSGKVAAAVLLGQALGAPDVALYFAALLATLGHNFSPFVGFRGGKGAATVLGISAVMLWQITAVTLGVGAVLFAVTRHPVWSMTGVFVLLNALTIGTSQPLGQILICLALSFIVAGTHFLRQYPQIVPAARQRDWRRFMTIE